MLLIAITVFVGIIYPLFITGIGQAFFNHKANGSLITLGGKVTGSALIGQPFSDPGYFWSRPSATTPVAYNADASGGSNLGPTNPALLKAIGDRIAALRAADPGNTAAGSHRPGDRLGQRARSRHKPGGRGIPGGAGRPGPGNVHRRCARSRSEVH